MRKTFIGAVGGVLLVPTLAWFNVIPPFMGWLVFVSLLYLLLPFTVSGRKFSFENKLDEMMVSAISPWTCERVSMLFSAIILIHGILFPNARVPSVMNVGVRDMEHMAVSQQALAMVSIFIVDYMVLVTCSVLAVFIYEYVLNPTAGADE